MDQLTGAGFCRSWPRWGRGRAGIGVLLLMTSLAGCGAGGSAGARDVRMGELQGRSGGPVTQAELQQDVQRFASELMFEVAQAADAVETDPRLRVRARVHRRALVYQATILDIASGQFPEINLLDMLVFATLARWAIENHWLARDLGPAGPELLATFGRAEKRLWDLSGKILTDVEKRQVENLLEHWEHVHPDLYLVEGVRFQHFAFRAGEVAAERAASARGLFGKVRSATRAADDALLLGERALFVAHRMPFLVRMQARVGAQDIFNDTLLGLENVQALVEDVPELRPFLQELASLVTESRGAAHEGRLLVAAATPLLDRLVGPGGAASPGLPDAGESSFGASQEGRPTDALSRLERITERTHLMMHEARKALPDDPEAVATLVERRTDRLVRRFALYLLAVGLGWAAFFWAGYALVKR